MLRLLLLSLYSSLGLLVVPSDNLTVPHSTTLVNTSIVKSL